jgi:CubicO group peptidase (beta-lactamase class C family)
VLCPQVIRSSGTSGEFDTALKIKENACLTTAYDGCNSKLGCQLPISSNSIPIALKIGERIMQITRTQCSEAARGFFIRAANQLDMAVKETLVPWATLLVVKDGREIFTHAAGTSLDHVDVLRSATKLATVTAVMTLVENGAVALEDPVHRYITSFAGEKAEITMRHLLSMNSGLPSSVSSVSDEMTLAKAADVIGQSSLAAEIGTKFIYGNLGLTVAGRVAEVVSGKNWDVFFQEALAEPLGMEFSYGPLESLRLGGGGRTNATHYGKLLQLHLSGGIHQGKRILSHALVAEMQRSNRAVFSNPLTEWKVDVCGYGMAWWFDSMDDSGQPSIISDCGLWGAYPWLDRQRHYAALLFIRKTLTEGAALQRVIRPLVERGVDSL